MARTGDPNSHISAIIRQLCIKLGHFEEGDAEPDAETVTRWEMGSAFEEAVRTGLSARFAQSNPHRYCVPGEVELDGLIGSLDLFDTEEMAVIEIKFTWLSSRHDPESEKFWKYWVQIMAYCWMMGVTTGYLHVGHINGNYRNSGPIYNVWKAVFTPNELSNNWRMLTTQRAVMSRLTNA